MRILVKEREKLQLPTQANPNEDAGYDVVATTEPQIIGEFIERPLDRMKVWRQIAYIQYGTGLFICPVSQKNGKIINANVDASGALCGLVRDESYKDYHIELFPRSSISKYNLVLANSVGTIDLGYRNEILVRFKYIVQPEDLVILPEANVQRVYAMVNPDAIYQQGDKIVQIKARKNTNIEFTIVKDLPASSRNMGGFGSSGN